MISSVSSVESKDKLSSVESKGKLSSQSVVINDFAYATGGSVARVCHRPFIIYIMYTSPLEDIVGSRGFGRMIYADDTQKTN